MQSIVSPARERVLRAPLPVLRGPAPRRGTIVVMDVSERRERRRRLVGWVGLVLALFIAFSAARMAPYSLAWCVFLALGAAVTTYAALRQLGIVKRR